MVFFFFLEMCLKLKCRFSQKYFCKNEVIIQNQNLFKMEVELFRSNIRWQLTENNTYLFFLEMYLVKNIFVKMKLLFKTKSSSKWKQNNFRVI
jgi:hypothetical protein